MHLRIFPHDGFVRHSVGFQPQECFATPSVWSSLNGYHIISHVKRSWIFKAILIEFKECLLELYSVTQGNFQGFNLAGTEPHSPAKERAFDRKRRWELEDRSSSVERFQNKHA